MQVLFGGLSGEGFRRGLDKTQLEHKPKLNQQVKSFAKKYNNNK